MLKNQVNKLAFLRTRTKSRILLCSSNGISYTLSIAGYLNRLVDNIDLIAFTSFKTILAVLLAQASIVIVMNLLQKLKSKFQFRSIRWWRVKSPEEKWDFIQSFGRSAGDLIGVRLFTDLKLMLYTATCAVLIVMFFALEFYTIQYYLRRGAVVRGMESTYLIGVATGVRNEFCLPK